MTQSGDISDNASYEDILQWTRGSRCGWKVSFKCFERSCGCRVGEVLWWERGDGDKIYCNPPLEAAAKGHLEVLQWLMLHGGCCWDPALCLAVAAMHRRYAVADWIRDNVNNFPFATK
jgi:hypothetical protein